MGGGMQGAVASSSQLAMLIGCTPIQPPKWRKEQDPDETPTAASDRLESGLAMRTASQARLNAATHPRRAAGDPAAGIQLFEGEPERGLRTHPNTHGSADGPPAAASLLQGHTVGVTPSRESGFQQQLSKARQH